MVSKHSKSEPKWRHKVQNKILDPLNEYQQKTMPMKVWLVKLKDKDKELWDRMKYKDAEVEQLKTELISQKEEPEEYEFLKIQL